MKTVGITGGIGAGKSLICQLFQLLGIPNYPADQRAKWLQSNDTALKEKISHHFGKEAYLENGVLNRAYLSKLVFEDGEKLKLLNSLVHPAVAKDFEKWCAEHSDNPYILKEAALLFETGSYKQLDATINVHASQEIRLKRTLRRDPQRTPDSVLSIMNKQMPDKERMELADYVIYNDESQSVIQQVMELNKQLLKK
jgi:dephospho-CoA kinase